MKMINMAIAITLFATSYADQYFEADQVVDYESVSDG